MKHRIYVDEVGNPDLASSDNPNHRFLSLTGVILELNYVQDSVQPQLEALKLKYFHSHPDEPIIFHRKEMFNAKEPFEALQQPNLRKKFDKELLDLLTAWDYTVISVCLDKKKHKDQYSVWRYDPYHYCLAVLLERFIYFLNTLESYGDVMAESRGGKEDIRLKESFNRLWEKGTDYVDQEQFQKRLTSRQLKVKTKSNNIAGLQLADILAHPSRNEILAENNFPQNLSAPFSQKVINILKNKYYRRDDDIYGKKFL